MDSLALDGAVAGCIAVGIAACYRRRAAGQPALPTTVPIARLIRGVRRRHRRRARAILELAFECLERQANGSFEAFTVRETVRSYLPETLSAYLAVPPALRRVRRAGRPSADDELSDQLRTLYSGLERIREADAEIGATRMAANGAFLNERFVSPERPRSSNRESMLGEIVDVLESALRRI